MESLLNAIDSAQPILLPMPQRKRSRTSSSSPQMSIESILDNRPIKRQCSPISPPPQSPIETEMSSSETTTLTCYHASVAQKSYGSEKRFLCPPPIIEMQNNQQRNATVSMSVVCETINPHPLLLEQQTKLDDEDKGCFKYLFVTGTAKAKHFSLRINHQQQTFYSNPISIISKPSKKTSKARNVSTCLFSYSLVSLFNRINSQTVRTKYLTSENNQLCAKHATWSPFEVIVLRQPKHLQHQSHVVVSTPITYGTEILLRDKNTGISSPPLIIKKVDKGQIVHQAFGVVSQMHKVALQLASSSDESPLYLNANGHVMEQDEQHNHHTSAWTNFISPTENTMSDYFCWTIVGISKFEYRFDKTLQQQPEEKQPQQQVLSSPPPSPHLRSIIPYPAIDYIPTTHSLKLSHHAPLTNYDVWLGQSIGPLKIQHSLCSLPDIQDILLSNHDLFLTKPDGTRYFELPLLLIKQQDGYVSQTGKSLYFFINNSSEGQWSIIETK